MLFLEDLYATKRPTLEERRAQLAAKQPRPVRRQMLRSETHNAGASSSPSTSQNSSKRTSIFSRRKSLTPTPATVQYGTSEIISRTQTAPTLRRQTTMEIATTDVDNLKSKFLSSWHPTKRAGPKKPTSASRGSPSTRQRSGNELQTRDIHKRAMSVGGADTLTNISKPFGFQHLAKIERSPKNNTTFGSTSQSSPVFPHPSEPQNADLHKSQRKPPPLRPKRPDDNQLPSELLSPRYDMRALRQIRSAEPITSPTQSPHAASLQFSTPQLNHGEIPPRRSSKLPPNAFGDRQAHDVDRLVPIFYEQNEFTGDEGEVKIPETMALPSPLPNAPLEQVIEEPEGTATPRPLRDSNRYPSLRLAKSSSSLPRGPSDFDDLEQYLPRISLLPSIMLPRPISGGSDTLGNLALRPFDIGCDILKCQQLSEVVDAFDFTSSWDEDIVFSYSYGAEAHSNFDWANTSQYLEIEDDTLEAFVTIAEPIHQRGRRHEFSSSWASTSGSESGAPTKRPSVGLSKVPKRDSVPELEEHVLSHSGSSNSLVIGTPQDQFGFVECQPEVMPTPQRKSGDSFDLISPQLPPLGLKHDLDSDRLFDDLMAGFNIKQQHSATLPILEPRTYGMPLPRKRSTTMTERVPRQPPTSAPNRISSASLDKELPPLPLQPRKSSTADETMQTMEVRLDTKAATEPLRQAPFARNASAHVDQKRAGSGSRGQILPATTFRPLSVKVGKTPAPGHAITVTHEASDSFPVKSPSQVMTHATHKQGKVADSLPQSSSAATAASKNKPNLPAFVTTCPISAAKQALRSPSLHKKAASADGVPLRPRGNSVTSPRHSVPNAYSLFPTPLPPPANIRPLPVTHMQRLTAL